MTLLLSCIAVFSYLPALHGDFIWDDKVLLTENAMIRAGDGLGRFWFTTEAYDYWPLTATTYWIEWRLWGMNPVGYHATNVALHAIEALLLWVILSRLNIGGAYLAALLFAVHPVNVESVAWIAQRKNLMAMLFVELAVLSYLRSDADANEPLAAPQWPWRLNRWYWLSMGAFALAVFGKGSAVTLPLILLLIVWWRCRRIAIRDLFRIAPFFLLAAGLALVNVWFQTHGNGPIRDVSALERLLGAGAVVWFYLLKALIPLRLAFVYPQVQLSATNPACWIPLAACLGVSVLLWQRRRTWGRPLLASWLFFCIGLLPVMGFADVYFMKYSLVADHYQHIALVGILALVAAAWSQWAAGRGRVPAFIFAAALVGVLAHLTRQQSALYKDEETLYLGTLMTNPLCWLCHYNLGTLMASAGRDGEALAHYEQAVATKPDFTEARVNLALMLNAQGHHLEALRHMEEVVRLAPQSWRVHYNLGLVLVAVGRASDAVREYEEALRLSPNDPETYNALGSARQQLGDYDVARHEFERALELEPTSAEAHVNLGLNLAHAGRQPEAIAHFEEALRFRPNDAAGHYNVAILLTDVGRKQEAITHYERALEERPDYAEAHNNLAMLLAEAGRGEDALGHYQRAVEIRPGFLEARMNLVQTLDKFGHPSEAIVQARATLDVVQATNQSDWEQRVRAWLTKKGAR